MPRKKKNNEEVPDKEPERDEENNEESPLEEFRNEYDDLDPEDQMEALGAFLQGFQASQNEKLMELLQLKEGDIEFLAETNKEMFERIMKLREHINLLKEMEVPNKKILDKVEQFFTDFDDYVRDRDATAYMMNLSYRNIHAPKASFLIEEKDVEHLEPMEEGDNITCPLCKCVHKVAVGINPDTNMKDNYNMFAECDTKGMSILCGRWGRSIMSMYEGE